MGSLLLRRSALLFFAVALTAPLVASAQYQAAYYQSPFAQNDLTRQLQQAQQTNAGGQTRVLQGIPAIARAFAPVAGVKWQDFANVLAGICAVESKCDPTYPHYVNGTYSQYQGLFQMNMYEVAKAENALQQMLPKMQAAAQSGDADQQKAFEFVKKAIDAARQTSGDRRFLPEYGVVLGAAKHIQINAQLARQYPDALHQAAGHMTAQFSGITEAKIRAGQFAAPVSGVYGNASTELGALSVNGVSGASTVAQAIEAAGARYGNVMKNMMARMSQVTNGLTTVPDNIQPFNAPAYRQGTTPELDEEYGGVSSLMESGYMQPRPAPPYPPSAPPSTTNIPPVTTSNSGTGGVNPSGGAVTPQSAALIIAQPSIVALGNPILVSWSSVGMTTQPPCQVSQGSSVIAQGNASSTLVQTRGLSAGTLTFTLSCTTLGGQVVTQSTSATLK
jgi:hypothetical protein